jgi:4-amino-4-deoxy-L-arabinose transferase-like glycosyltransferase
MLLPLVPPLALLAALGLPTIRRGLTSLIDWFAVMTFTLIGLALWAYWIAFQTGWPPRMAFRAQQSVIGFEPEVHAIELVLGLTATLAWILLVAWRVARHPKALWRTMILSAGGLVLTWSLLMTLWLPAGNYRKTYRDVAQQAGAVVAAKPGCVRTVGLDLAHRTSFAYFGRLGIDDANPECPWLLLAERPQAPIDVERRVGGRWQVAWSGQRPADRQERFRLLQRVPER